MRVRIPSTIPITIGDQPNGKATGFELVIDLVRFQDLQPNSRNAVYRNPSRQYTVLLYRVRLPQKYYRCVAQSGLECVVWGDEVEGSNPSTPTNFARLTEMDQWWSEKPHRLDRYQHLAPKHCGSSSDGRAEVYEASCRWFDPILSRQIKWGSMY